MQPSTVNWGLVILLVASVVPARAELVISIGSTTIAPGASGSIDVDITNVGSSSVQINDYGFQLQITPDANGLTQLGFLTPTAAQLGYLSDASLNPPYVFLGDSADAQAAFVGGGPSLTVYPADTFTATDSTISGNPVTIASGQTLLLAIVPITTATGLPPGTGDSFSVSLIPGSGNGSFGPTLGNSTYFDVFNWNTLYESSATPFSSMPGTVMIAGASVPEPCSLISAAIATLVGAVVIRRRRGSASGPPAPATCPAPRPCRGPR